MRHLAVLGLLHAQHTVDALHQAAGPVGSAKDFPHRSDRLLADRIGILDGGRLLALDTAEALRRRYDAPTLEDAFLAATGHALEDQEEEAA